jgi:hypothetical protein
VNAIARDGFASYDDLRDTLDERASLLDPTFCMNAATVIQNSACPQRVGHERTASFDIGSTS